MELHTGPRDAESQQPCRRCERRAIQPLAHPPAETDGAATVPPAAARRTVRRYRRPSALPPAKLGAIARGLSSPTRTRSRSPPPPPPAPTLFSRRALFPRTLHPQRL